VELCRKYKNSISSKDLQSAFCKVNEVYRNEPVDLNKFIVDIENFKKRTATDKYFGMYYQMMKIFYFISEGKDFSEEMKVLDTIVNITEYSKKDINLRGNVWKRPVTRQNTFAQLQALKFNTDKLLEKIKSFSIINKIKIAQQKNNQLIHNINVELAKVNLNHKRKILKLFDLDFRYTFIVFVLNLIPLFYENKHIRIQTKNDRFINTCRSIKGEILKAFENGSNDKVNELKMKYDNLISTFTVYNQGQEWTPPFKPNGILSYSISPIIAETLRANYGMFEKGMFNINDKDEWYAKKERRYFVKDEYPTINILKLYETIVKMEKAPKNINRTTKKEVNYEVKNLFVDNYRPYKDLQNRDESVKDKIPLINKLIKDSMRHMRSILLHKVFTNNVCHAIKSTLFCLKEVIGNGLPLWEVIFDNTKNKAFEYLFLYILDKRIKNDRSVYAKKLERNTIKKFLSMYKSMYTSLKASVSTLEIREDDFTGLFSHSFRQLPQINNLTPLDVIELEFGPKRNDVKRRLYGKDLAKKIIEFEF